MAPWLILQAASLAFPSRADVRRTELVPGPGRDPETLVFMLREDAVTGWAGDRPLVAGGLQEVVDRSSPLFRRPASVLAREREKVDPRGELADLRLYFRLSSPDAQAVGTGLAGDPRIQHAYLAPLPVPPPSDLAPPTPDFSELQLYIGAAPGGFGVSAAWPWPGGMGENVAIADIEYGWDPQHEDIGAAPQMFAWGWDSGDWDFHGNGVLSILGAYRNGYGVDGAAPGAELLMVSPYVSEDEYSVAAAIDAAAGLLDAGDVLLIEQQGFDGTVFCPVEWEPAVFDVIALAVAKGVIVVEPAGNGAVDLDAPSWNGWFDREVQDSGAILVGGGASPLSGYEPGSWYPGGTAYGSRVDLQAWFDSIVSSGGDGLADLFYPGADARQACTTAFGGSSGASAIVAGIAAQASSISWELSGGPWDPMELRTALASSGVPQPPGSSPVGPRPDLQRFLWMWALR